MTRSDVFISFCVIIVCIHATVQLECSLNEASNAECRANCLASYCLEYEGQDRSCPKPEACGPPECKCGFDTRRAANGTCIHIYKCPPFVCDRPNEEFRHCSPYCPTDDCKDASPDGRCPIMGLLLLAVECRPACRCIKGYWRNNGKCVPYEQCPPADRSWIKI